MAKEISQLLQNTVYPLSLFDPCSALAVLCDSSKDVSSTKFTNGRGVFSPNVRPGP